MAQHDAEAAPAYADFTIDFAYSAVEEAEYAVLDAVLARMDAEASGSKVPSCGPARGGTRPATSLGP